MFDFSKLFLSSRKVLHKKPLNVLCLLIRYKFTSGSNSKTHYEILNVSKNCSSKEIREAFISLSKQYHPDKNKNNPNAQDQFVKVNEAYNVLIKPESRLDYDISLGQQYRQTATKDEFYQAHRYDSQYRDPWKDPSFARNRNFSKEDSGNYYGVKGLKKQSNDRIVFWIFIFFTVGLLLQIGLIKFAHVRNLDSLQRHSDANRQHLEYVRARADSYGTRERQIEEYKRRLVKTNAED
uniref:J domain-containing protein n=1 Tax=Graphocephala atropunctata TaxID=36148 RepID=A0A1B6LMW2_9HEMI